MALSFDAKKNFAYSVVAVAPSPAASGTSLQVAATDGAKFPATPFNAVIWPTGVQPTTANAEVVRVTNIATDTFTITRAQEGSSARTVIVNDQIALNITAKTLTDIEDAFTTATVLAMPIGASCIWFTDTAPTGYIFARGQAISRTTYSELFTLWGTLYGAGDGSTTFNVPNMQARLPIGRDTTGTYTTIDSVGEVTGSFDHTHTSGTLTVASHTHGPGTLQVASHTHDSGTLQVASHTHGAGTFAAASHSHDSGTYGTSSDGSHTHTGTTSSAGDHTHPLTTSDAATGGDFAAVTDVQNAGDHTHGFTTDAGGSHSHSLTGSSGSTAPAVSGTSGSTAPAVSSGSTGSASPLVTAGVSAATAPAVSSGSTASANPPVMAINFIIRATNEV